MDDDVVQLQPKERLIRIDEVIGRVGIRTTEIYRRMGEGSFPRGIRLGHRTTVWPESAIDQWIANQVNCGSVGQGR
ncbi:AlpA family transcriptional regulator [Variovorax sp. Sphag1AA]|uniref:helix-turn-helix transcriptional regulator n=1 Tax=Variovorax sp. Sphag1AA TaxID=2587027 RepID=UPI0016130175|nr:AlpA family phage regulatory protein [Variovorax sp. Sphag1AA]MBB3179743.1 prophage regulatory protein [Variovorax sp. Sphag1AA]